MFTKKQKEKYDNEIARLRHEIAELTQIIKTQELLKLRDENARLKEKEQLINKVKFRLKDVAFIEEGEFILVKYQVPPVKVLLNEKGEIQKNELFYAINKLQLLSLEDMKKVSRVVENVKLLKQNKK